jgi:hypothetical protein
MKATDIIIVVEGYDAMRIFLETVRRAMARGRSVFVLGSLKSADGTAVDPTMWEDWLAAVQTACICRTR